MIQAAGSQKLHYAFRVLQTDALGARVARAVQSAAAEGVLQALRLEAAIPQGPSSKAHSRAVAAAAIVENGRVGVDVEYHAPDRPIGKIAHYLMGSHAPDDESAYRVFTFYEAYFKAIGAFPPRSDMRAVAEMRESAYTLPQGERVSHARIADAFTLTLIHVGS